MIAGGIDIGGTKIEAQLFAEGWQLAEARRVPSPGDYDALLKAVAELVGWLDAAAGGPLPVGVAAAGLVRPETGLALTANLPATGRPLMADLARAAGRPLSLINDCRAFTLSEALRGAGRGARAVVGLILGTGCGGGIAVGGRLLEGPAGLGGEFGHLPAPAHLVAEHGLPLARCGCGRQGCIETLISGPGMRRLARHLLGRALPPEEIAAGREGAAAPVWRLWCALVAELLRAIQLMVDPEVIVLGGGLSRIEGVAGALAEALGAARFEGFPLPAIRLAEGGDASGARGAAMAALAEAGTGGAGAGGAGTGGANTGGASRPEAGR